MSTFDEQNCDLIEAILSPVQTKKPWMYSLACFQEALAFNFFGLPIPRKLRITYMSYLFKKNNFKNLLFWSQAGKNTLTSHAKISDPIIWEKSEVIYPAIREADKNKIQFNHNKVNILFSGDFFRKGGVNVIDAFIRAKKQYNNISLRVCCDEKIDFNTPNQSMRNEYLQKIKSTDNIIFGRVARDEMINKILPNTDIYLLPTYHEAFGFAILEAMAFGIPVISTNHMAIPEIVSNNESGFLIDTKKYDYENLFKGYIVDTIPEEFNQLVTDNLYRYLCELIESPDLRKKMGENSIDISRQKFSFESRNKKMQTLYQQALEP